MVLTFISTMYESDTTNYNNHMLTLIFRMNDLISIDMGIYVHSQQDILNRDEFRKDW